MFNGLVQAGVSGKQSNSDNSYTNNQFGFKTDLRYVDFDALLEVLLVPGKADEHGAVTEEVVDEGVLAYSGAFEHNVLSPLQISKESRELQRKKREHRQPMNDGFGA